MSETERGERKTERQTERQTGKRSEFCFFPFRVTGSDLLANHRRKQTGSDQSDHFSERLCLLLQFSGSTVQSQQHGDRFLQELAELREPLRSDGAVHHPVVAAQRHRHHAGHVKPVKTNARCIRFNLKDAVCEKLLLYGSHDTDPFSLSAGISRFSEPPTARIQD